MEVGIVGLPYTGKSTLFKALTGLQPEPGAMRGTVGTAHIPDPRLDLIASLITTQKIIPASLKVVDVPGLVRGASSGEGLGNAFLSQVRDVDALIHVVRCFASDEVPHVDGSLNPVRDLETVETELILADLQMVENAIPRAEKSLRKDPGAAKRLAVLKKAEPLLSDAIPARNLELTDADEILAMRGLAMLSAKPVLIVANVDESDVEGAGEHAQAARAHAEQSGAGFLALSAKLESELAELEGEDRSEMLESLGIAQPALGALAREAYRLLGLQSFYTAGPKEVRAWTIRRGATAPKAAGAIHTDFERGFIRVEVYKVSDLEELKSEKAIKEAGRLRVEGKSYVMQDGDVCHFLFNT